jgi:hypothetical protein
MFALHKIQVQYIWRHTNPNDLISLPVSAASNSDYFSALTVYTIPLRQNAFREQQRIVLLLVWITHSASFSTYLYLAFPSNGNSICCQLLPRNGACDLFSEKMPCNMRARKWSPLNFHVVVLLKPKIFMSEVHRQSTDRIGSDRPKITFVTSGRLNRLNEEIQNMDDHTRNIKQGTGAVKLSDTIRICPIRLSTYLRLFWLMITVVLLDLSRLPSG